ncbi:MAG TPA: cytochrome P450, partial [Asanoa sp.]|nr:cytochrome P450 [Asanoa sp.]
MVRPPGCPVGSATPSLADPMIHASTDFRARWAVLRAQDGLQWTQVDERHGFWSAARYADVERVLRDASTFTSERGTVLSILGFDDPAGGRQLAATDPPRHTAMRTRLQKALAVRAVEGRHEVLTGLIREIIEPLADGGVFDFAEAMLALPVAVAGEAMGLPRGDWPRLGFLLTAAIAADDPEFRPVDSTQGSLDRAHRELFAYFQDIYMERRHRPGDDLVSVLITTEVDDRAMS